MAEPDIPHSSTFGRGQEVGCEIITIVENDPTMQKKK